MLNILLKRWLASHITYCNWQVMQHLLWGKEAGECRPQILSVVWLLTSTFPSSQINTARLAGSRFNEHQNTLNVPHDGRHISGDTLSLYCEQCILSESFITACHHCLIYSQIIVYYWTVYPVCFELLNICSK